MAASLHQYSRDLTLALQEHIRHSPRKPAKYWRLLYTQGALQIHIFSAIPLPHWSDLTSVFHLLHASPSEVSPLLCNTFCHQSKRILLMISAWGAMSTPHDEAGIVKGVPHAQSALCCPNSMCTTPVSAHTLRCHPRALKKIVLLLPLAFSRINLKRLVSWHNPVIITHGRWRQEDQGFKASVPVVPLSYIRSPNKRDKTRRELFIDY